MMPEQTGRGRWLRRTACAVLLFTLTVGPAAAVAPPPPNPLQVGKGFTPGNGPVLGAFTLFVDIANTNPQAVTGIGFTDTLPAGVVITGTPSSNCGGTVSSTSTTLTLSGGSLAAGSINNPSRCTVTIGVVNTAGTGTNVTLASGVYTNTIAAGGVSSSIGSNAAPVSGNLNIIGAYKSVRVQTDADASGTPTTGDTLQWSVFYRNPTGGATLPSFRITDTLGANMTLAGAPAVSYTPAGCSGGTANAAFNGAGNPNLFTAAFTFNANCTVRVDYSVTVGAVAPGTILSNQAGGSGSELNAGLTDNIDNTTTGLPPGVTPTASSVVQNQIGNAISPTTVTIQGAVAPSITVVKSSSVFSDPISNTSNPKRIPGSFVTYSIVTTNSGAGAANNNSVVMTDPIPANTILFVGDVAGAGSGPVMFVDGAPSSGLSYTFTSLASATDDVSFSIDGGATFNYTPTPDGNGVDAAVTNIRVNPKGVYAADAVPGAPSPNFSLSFRVRIQ